MSDGHILPFRKVWWLNPSYIVGVFLIPVYLLLWIAGVYTGGNISTAKGFYFFHGEYAFLGLFALIIMYVGTLSPIKYIQKPRILTSTRVDVSLSMKTLSFIGCIAIAGYIYWFKDLILNPNLLISLVKQSASIGVRGEIERSAGIASFAQVGLVYLMVFTYQYLLDKSKLIKLHYFLFYMIIFCIVARVFLWSERLALFEIMIAIILVWISYSRVREKTIELMFLFIPLIGVIFVVLFFALGEYFRSWSSFYITQSEGFWEFIFQRLINYYFEALNTGTGMLTTQEWPTYEFSYILAWLHKLPFIGSLFSYAIDVGPNVTRTFLDEYSDPEFNSPSGLFSVFVDVGIGAGLLLFFLLGILSRYFYSMLEDRVYFYGLFYFIFLMMFFEMFRYFYLGESRVFMIVLGFFVLVVTQKNKVYKV